MDMIAKRLRKNPSQLFSLSGICPHCGNGSAFVIPKGHGSVAFEDNWFAAMQCQSCLEFILGVVTDPTKSTNNGCLYVTHYPIGTPSGNVANGVPPAIASDFSEALRCYSFKCYKATVTMCRRALQAACLDLKARKRKNLQDQIDDLAKKSTITEPLRQQAHDVKLGGNDGAHPNRDGLDNVSPDDAEDMIDFTRDFIHHVYPMPDRLEKRQMGWEA